MDRQLARRFSVFKYLRTDELGLSQIIADLLDPAAEHGQGAMFLNAMVDLLPETRGRLGTVRETTSNMVKVVTERHIPKDRRIDISVDIPTPNGSYCLAFENKPYAQDQPRQIIDYLEFLNGTYGSRFLLVYVPPYDREPDESALPSETRAHWRGNLRVMPYSESDISLEAWLANCRKRCETERLIWFLRQAQSFCRQQFGGLALTTDAESREIRAHLAENPGHLQAALAIHDAWPLIRSQICEAFLKHLRDNVEDRLQRNLGEAAANLVVSCEFGEEKKYAAMLTVKRDGSVPYYVMLQCGSRGATWWQWGVCSAKSLSEMSEDELQIREKVSEALLRRELSIGQDDNHRWPQRQWVPRFENWHQLAPELDSEVNGARSEITDYYASELLRMAEIAFPAIDEVTVASRADPT